MAQLSPASATGSVQFFDAQTLLGTVTISAGKAALPVSSLALGGHSITAVYSGAGNFAGSTSAGGCAGRRKGDIDGDANFFSESIDGGPRC